MKIFGMFSKTPSKTPSKRGRDAANAPQSAVVRGHTRDIEGLETDIRHMNTRLANAEEKIRDTGIALADARELIQKLNGMLAELGKMIDAQAAEKPRKKLPVKPRKKQGSARP